MMKIIFLDRDGVINKYPGHGNYVTEAEGFEFIDGSLLAIRLLKEAGYKIYVISNQRGIGKGIFTQEALDEITKKMLSGVKEAGGAIDKFLCCIHAEDCECRKPKTTMFKEAAGDLGEGFKQVYFIGDDVRDIEAAKNLGCKSILVYTGKTAPEQTDELEFKPDHTAQNLLEAVKAVVL